MHPETRRIVYLVCNQLGTERVEAGLKAFEPDYDSDGWSGNFLALAYGPKNRLVRAWMEAPNHQSILLFIERNIGVTAEAAHRVLLLFEDNPKELEAAIHDWFYHEMGLA